MTIQPELIADYACETGENPMWHPDEQRVYWVDIPSGRLFRYTPATGQHELCFESPEQLGAATLQSDGSLLLFFERGVVRRWRDGLGEVVLGGIAGEETSRFNDAIADPSGRVFCGTMPTSTRKGRLYRLDLDGAVTPVVEDVGCTNGLGFAPDRSQLYYTDSTTLKVYQFDYDMASGAIGGQRTFAKAEHGGGLPDGLTVDAEGYIWSARWDGGCVVRYAPDGSEVARYRFPVPKVSSCSFGGPDYRDLYVTTAGGNQKDVDGPTAGALYVLRGVGQGVPEFRSRILL
ncbi:SMP-30/gluconolactonase/LRE family protein [Chloroflexia bacterium SDU3-3]|nr:SMP-30/gluconolactonase/LRE family protein [Chloroflexia bacterium SDU3-3]